MSRTLAEATSRFLARRNPRRGFLAKTAVVGSALAVAPKAFVTRPASAYARICNCNGSSCDCSQLCCDGYTEFCCTLYGTNGCPPGSLYGGWWRVSGSNYCGGSNRYYLDCHNPCGDCACGASGICSGACNGTACGCALGSCRNRKAGCTHFRYGQCNQQEKCLGPIICRVITCTPPWQLEPNCTTSIRTDEATRNHNRPCLTDSNNVPVGRLELVDGQPGTIRVRGWALDPDVRDAVRVRIAVNGRSVATVTADQSRPDVGAAYGSFGEDHGFDATFTATIGTKEVCATAINADGGTNTLLGCATVTVSASRPTGVVETISATDDGVDIVGWAHQAGSRSKLDVDITVDGEIVTTVTAGIARSDIPRPPGTGRRHGFKASIPLDAKVATVCASVTDPETGQRIPLGCVTVDNRSEPPYGDVESVDIDGDVVRVTGFAFDPDGGDAEIGLFVDGAAVARVAADQPRPDLTEEHPLAETTGGYVIETSPAAGDHNVCVYSFGSDGDEGPLLGCAAIVVDTDTTTTDTNDPADDATDTTDPADDATDTTDTSEPPATAETVEPPADIADPAAADADAGDAGQTVDAGAADE